MAGLGCYCAAACAPGQPAGGIWAGIHVCTCHGPAPKGVMPGPRPVRAERAAASCLTGGRAAPPFGRYVCAPSGLLPPCAPAANGLGLGAAPVSARGAGANREHPSTLVARRDFASRGRPRLCPVHHARCALSTFFAASHLVAALVASLTPAHRWWTRLGTKLFEVIIFYLPGGSSSPVQHGSDGARPQCGHKPQPAAGPDAGVSAVPVQGEQSGAAPYGRPPDRVGCSRG